MSNDSIKPSTIKTNSKDNVQEKKKEKTQVPLDTGKMGIVGIKLMEALSKKNESVRNKD